MRCTVENGGQARAARLTQRRRGPLDDMPARACLWLCLHTCAKTRTHEISAENKQLDTPPAAATYCSKIVRPRKSKFRSSSHTLALLRPRRTLNTHNPCCCAAAPAAAVGARAPAVTEIACTAHLRKRRRRGARVSVAARAAPRKMRWGAGQRGSRARAPPLSRCPPRVVVVSRRGPTPTLLLLLLLCFVSIPPRKTITHAHGTAKCAVCARGVLVGDLHVHAFRRAPPESARPRRRRLLPLPLLLLALPHLRQSFHLLRQSWRMETDSVPPRLGASSFYFLAGARAPTPPAGGFAGAPPRPAEALAPPFGAAAPPAPAVAAVGST